MLFFTGRCQRYSEQENEQEKKFAGIIEEKVEDKEDVSTALIEEVTSKWIALQSLQ